MLVPPPTLMPPNSTATAVSVPGADGAEPGAAPMLSVPIPFAGPRDTRPPPGGTPEGGPPTSTVPPFVVSVPVPGGKAPIKSVPTLAVQGEFGLGGGVGETTPVPT